VLKLTAALPASRQEASSRVAQRIVIDSAPWSGRSEPIGHLAVLHRATMEDRWVAVTFTRPFVVQTKRRAAPYGLVAKAGAWFVVWAGEDDRFRVDRVSQVHAAVLEEARFARAADFDLETFWRAWCERQETARPTFDVRLRVRRDAVEYVEDALGARHGVFYTVPTMSDEWVTMDASFPFLEEARREILALGGAVEVLGPEALRRSVADFADQIRARYNEAPSASA
jgi:predicted DNA-binding transcriptional regulator YafY